MVTTVEDHASLLSSANHRRLLQMRARWIRPVRCSMQCLPETSSLGTPPRSPGRVLLRMRCIKFHVGANEYTAVMHRCVPWMILSN
ncbi:hypothetical protein MUK42_28270 [Musa troglodytarum]|uniref:Uncharacterized protein n=1 Tax=Musa troglodytarum TaxID=320322 RepID=A0A9E7FSR0_9LILI|nr:hypothetical protein MUK42_28270 [Musa troglodytarum]